MSEPYQMPAVALGDPVYFYEGGNRALAPKPGYVSAVNARSICVHVISQETYNFLIRDGARHVSDPVLTSNPHAREDGAWDYHPIGVRLAALEARVAELEKLVA